MVHLKILEQQQQSIPKITGKKEITKFRAEINEVRV
jgi:hypothetical protein